MVLSIKGIPRHYPAEMDSTDRKDSDREPVLHVELPTSAAERSEQIAGLKASVETQALELKSAREELDACRKEMLAIEDRLEEKEEQYRLFIKQMLNGFTYNRIIFNDNGKPTDFVILEANDAFLRSTQLEREKIIDVPVSSYIPEIKLFNPDLVQLAASVSLPGESFQGEIYFKTFGKWFEVSAHSTHKGYFNAIFKDISQRKKAEAELAESKAYLEYSLNSAPDGVLLLGKDLHFSYMNPAVLDIFGVGEGEFIGKTALELAPDLLSRTEAEWIHTGLTELMHTDDTIKGYEVELNRSNGDIIPASISAAGIRDKNRHLIGVVVFIKNITERKRTQELMVQTEKMMSVGGLAAGMAHEINNPLGGMLQGAQNIHRRLSPGLEANSKDARDSGVDLEKLALYIKKRKIDEMLAGIISSGKRAARIITNMLQFSRQSESNLCPNDINKLIDEVLELSANEYDLVKKYDFRKIEVVKAYDGNLPLVPCTKTEIEQVMLNLLKNAAHAMMQSETSQSPRILIRTRVNDSFVQIEVQDNGPGMDQVARSKAFEPFYTTKPVGTGTGLGLSVSYMIVTANHKGTMEVVSEPGRGACFIVNLPLTNDAVS